MLIPRTKNKFLSVAVMLAAICIGCKSSESHEVANVASPNGALKAVVTESNGGATTSFGYDVNVGLNRNDESKRVATLYGATRNANAYGVNLHWTGDDTLQIEYFKAKAVLNVVNAVEVSGRSVRVVLVGGRLDPTAKAGSMWLNRQKDSSR
jgi:hypothetical protein